MFAPIVLTLALAVTPTVTVLWEMPTPDGGWVAPPTNETATWDQVLHPGGELKCGTYYQQDEYLPDEAARFTADGILTLGEDYATDTQRGAISWAFIYGGDCPVEPPVVVPPVQPPVVVPPVIPPVVPPVVVPPVVPPVVVPQPPVVVAPPVTPPVTPPTVPVVVTPPVTVPEVVVPVVVTPEPVAAPTAPVLANTGTPLLPLTLAGLFMVALGAGLKKAKKS